MTHKTQYKLSVVTTLYNSAEFIKEFFERINHAVTKHYSENEIEYIFVDDGSPDRSNQTVLDLIKQNENKNNITLITLSRNFGHHPAMMAGLKASSGDQVFLIDIDLETNPEEFERFHTSLNADTNLDVVFGVRKNRNESFLKKMSGKYFYKLFNMISDIKLPEELLVIRLMKKNYVESLRLLNESEILAGGVWEFVGFNHKPLEVEKAYKGKSSYKFSSNTLIALNFIITFSSKPLMIMFALGIFMSMLSFFTAIYYFFVWVFTSAIPSGYSSIILSIWILGSMTLGFLGVLSAYINIIFKESKRRPYVVVKDRTSCHQ